jgi:hypothetical protein
MLKKLVVVLLLGSTAAYADVLTAQQIQQAITAEANVQAADSRLWNFVTSVSNLQQAGWSFSVPVDTDTITLTTQQQTDIIAQYEVLKANLLAAYNQLP